MKKALLLAMLVSANALAATSDITIPPSKPVIWHAGQIHEKEQKSYPPNVIFTGNPINQTVYFTFDDGPDPKTTPQVLAILKKNNIKATFFLVGKKIKKYPELTKKIAEDGHTIGSHSYHHFRFNEISEQKIEQEIVWNQIIIKKTLGITPTLFRTPYGIINDTILQKLNDNNLKLVLWSIDSYDYKKGIKSKQIYEIIKRKLKPGKIFLFHDIKTIDLEILPEIIKMLKEQGYSIRPIT